MNAIHTTASNPPAAVAAISPARRFGWLLRREYWEHRGGFLWASVITAGITLLFTLIGAIGGSVMNSKFGGNDIRIGNDEHGKIAEVLGAVGDVALLSGIAITMMVLGFVVFFYALGSLYDDRRDRSILFWKSLPVSDAATVTSKVAWALLLAPLLAVGVGIGLGLMLWVVAALTTSVNGLPDAMGVFTHSHPFRIVGSVLALIPLYALWALPTIGWLMLCSAAARSKPFLWAVIVPVLGCALVSFVNAILRFNLDIGMLWYSVAYRGLLSAVPGTWMPRTNELSTLRIASAEDIPLIISPAKSWLAATTPDLWIGVVAGLVMIYAAIRLRRWRDDG